MEIFNFCPLANHLALKIDLVLQEYVEKWLKYLIEELPTVAFKCSTQQQRSNLGWKSSKATKSTDILQNNLSIPFSLTPNPTKPSWLLRR
ncbi:hypothetical protein Fmac_028400 [Flemingia macrophylla]|uniref:Uncharacterized protein n=1 Tax=Flemingia macrophylla TaxID=520843 RepID=A0ABD1L7F2_9FABA